MVAGQVNVLRFFSSYITKGNKSVNIFKAKTDFYAHYLQTKDNFYALVASVWSHNVVFLCSFLCCMYFVYIWCKICISSAFHVFSNMIEINIHRGRGGNMHCQCVTRREQFRNPDIFFQKMTKKY